ncbi:MAG: M48 family metallopeptidase, partial [Synergistaceae bacterium]|nr:M48 family metallopeptidase [Synergistaceae bacterium]
MRGYLDGENFPYHGSNLILKAAPAEAVPKVSVSEDGAFLLVAPRFAEERKKFILFFYTARTEEFIRSTLPAWTKRMGARPSAVAVRYAKTRWGSCSAKGRIFFNSRLSMLSDDVAEYIVVHELCHLRQMNHGNAFWDDVRSLLPGCMALRRKLRAE